MPPKKLAEDRSGDAAEVHSAACKAVKHPKGNWCWTKDEQEQLKFLVELDNDGCDWVDIAQNFKAQREDGAVVYRHHSFACQKLARKKGWIA